ncbi:MAG: hypothetical protein MJ237_06085 [bacterium]|nr:hypothetical protein [bacterium]
MTALETKILALCDEFSKANGFNPSYASVTIRWNDDKTFVPNTIIAIDGDETKEYDDDVFFICESVSHMLPICANIDFTSEDFIDTDDFYNEIDKYDTDDMDNEDWTYLHRGEDFTIVDIDNVF